MVWACGTHDENKVYAELLDFEPSQRNESQSTQLLSTEVPANVLVKTIKAYSRD